MSPRSRPGLTTGPVVPTVSALRCRGGRDDGRDDPGDPAVAVALAAGRAVVRLVAVVRRLEEALAGPGRWRLGGGRPLRLRQRPGLVGHLPFHLQLPGFPPAEL